MSNPLPAPEADPSALGAPVGVSSRSDEALPPLPASRRRGLRGLLPKPIWRIGKLLVVALIVEYLVLPQIAGTRQAAHLLSQVNPLLLLVGFALEAAAIAAYAQLTRTVLPGDDRPSYFTVLRIQVTTLSVSHCVPGGTYAGTPIGYRLLAQSGVKRSDVGFALGLAGIGSALVLNVILWVALIVSIPVWGFSPVYLAAAAVGVLLLGAFIGLIAVFTRGEQRAGSALERAAARLPFVDGAALRRSFESIALRVRELGRQRQVMGRAIGWAAANWLLDAASLTVFVAAFGHFVNPDGLLVSYGLANVLAAIPLTPGGLGVVEATLTSTLVGFGTPRGIAILGVLAYRLVNFWLPIPVGGVAYLSLQIDPAVATGQEPPGRLRRLGARLGGPGGRRPHHGEIKV